MSSMEFVTRIGAISNSDQVDRRIIIDAESHSDSGKRILGYLLAPEFIPLTTCLIRQAPAVSLPPPDGHVPLPMVGQRKVPRGFPPPGNDFGAPPMPMMGASGKKRGGRQYNQLPPPPPPMEFVVNETPEEARKSWSCASPHRPLLILIKLNDRRNLSFQISISSSAPPQSGVSVSANKNGKISISMVLKMLSLTLRPLILSFCQRDIKTLFLHLLRVNSKKVIASKTSSMAKEVDLSCYCRASQVWARL